MKPSGFDWPPPYTIKVSPRSKRMTLRITPRKGLEIIIPRRASQKKALLFLNSKYDWVQKYRHLILPTPAFLLPASLDLIAIGQKWTVVYQLNENQRPSLKEDSFANNLVIKANKSNICLMILKKWIKQKARIHLADMLDACSKQNQLNYTGFQVRLQQARWGSCSRNKRINLNCKLLFIPFEMAYYVIVHELIHTIHFDHSPRFWEAVAKIVPNYKALKLGLKNIEHQLPNWLYC